MDDLSNRLRAAQTGAAPGRDLWPDIERRLTSAPERHWQHAAAAVVLFAAGALSGALITRGDGGVVSASSDATAASSLHAAVAVQRTGSDYLAAVGRLRALEQEDEALRLQGYEAALGVLAATAEEVEAVLELDSDDALITQARRARAAASERATARVRRGGE